MEVWGWEEAGYLHSNGIYCTAPSSVEDEFSISVFGGGICIGWCLLSSFLEDTMSLFIFVLMQALGNLILINT